MQAPQGNPAELTRPDPSRYAIRLFHCPAGLSPSLLFFPAEAVLPLAFAYRRYLDWCPVMTRQLFGYCLDVCHRATVHARRRGSAPGLQKPMIFFDDLREGRIL